MGCFLNSHDQDDDQITNIRSYKLHHNYYYRLSNQGLIVLQNDDQKVDYIQIKICKDYLIGKVHEGGQVDAFTINRQNMEQYLQINEQEVFDKIIRCSKNCQDRLKKLKGVKSSFKK